MNPTIGCFVPGTEGRRGHLNEKRDSLVRSGLLSIQLTVTPQKVGLSKPNLSFPPFRCISANFFPKLLWLVELRFPLRSLKSVMRYAWSSCSVRPKAWIFGMRNEDELFWQAASMEDRERASPRTWGIWPEILQNSNWSLSTASTFVDETKLKFWPNEEHWVFRMFKSWGSICVISSWDLLRYKMVKFVWSSTCLPISQKLNPRSTLFLQTKSSQARFTQTIQKGERVTMFISIQQHKKGKKRMTRTEKKYDRRSGRETQLRGWRNRGDRKMEWKRPGVTKVRKCEKKKKLS